MLARVFVYLPFFSSQILGFIYWTVLILFWSILNVAWRPEQAFPKNLLEWNETWREGEK